MKYVLLFVIAIILIRIDKVIELGEKGFMMFQSESPRIQPDELGEPPVIVRSDVNVRLKPRQQFLSFMDSFRVSPNSSYREEAMSVFRDHPQIFSDKLDKDLEARIYSWRDLIVQNEEELPLFLIDLMNILKGENKATVTRFLSVVMDLNIDMFMASYPRSKDPACAPVIMIEAAVPPEEKFPELYERLSVLEEYTSRETIAPDKKLYANLCLNTLKLYLDKEGSSVPPVVETLPEAGTTP